MVKWLEEAKANNINNIQGLIPSDSIPAKITRGTITGLSNAGYDLVNGIAEMGINTAKNVALGPVAPVYNIYQGTQLVKNIPQTVQAGRQAIQNMVNNPAEKIPEVVGYVGGSLALGGLGAKALPKTTPKVAPKATPKTSQGIPTIPKNNNGANIKIKPKATTAQSLEQKSQGITNKTVIGEINNPYTEFQEVVHYSPNKITTPYDFNRIGENAYKTTGKGMFTTDDAAYGQGLYASNKTGSGYANVYNVPSDKYAIKGDAKLINQNPTVKEFAENYLRDVEGMSEQGIKYEMQNTDGYSLIQRMVDTYGDDITTVLPDFSIPSMYTPSSLERQIFDASYLQKPIRTYPLSGGLQNHYIIE